MGKVRVKIILLILCAIILAGAAFLPTPYLLVKPGEAENLNQMVTIKNSYLEENSSRESSFYLVTVKKQQANLLWLLYGAINPGVEIRLHDDTIPPHLDEEEYQEMLQKWMEESQLMAKVIALQEAGYEVEITGKGVQVYDFLEESPAQDLLEVGDVIKKVDGKEVNVVDEVISLVQSRNIGDEVELTVERNGNIKEVISDTVPHDDDPDEAALGILISALEWEADLPLSIEIDAGPIGGPSAGMMFVLELLDQLSEGKSLGGSHSIAGTGTINLNQEIGSIGGVPQKVQAAERSGVDFFLVPQNNYLEAQNAADKIEVVPVETFQDVDDFLKDLAEH